MGAPTLQKIVRGKRVSQREFRREVMAAIDAGGEEGRTIEQIADHLGEPWDQRDLRPILSHTLQNFKATGKVICPSRGVYVAAVAAVDIFTDHENSILQVIRDHGGVCRWVDILDAYDVRNIGRTRPKRAVANYPEGVTDHERLLIDEEIERDFQARTEVFELENPRASSIPTTLRKVIAQSTRIRQDFMQIGLYNLPLEELQGLPLLGRWLRKATVKTALGDRPPRDRDELNLTRDTIYDMVDQHFARVGAVFLTVVNARGATLADVATDETIRPHLMRLSKDDDLLNQVLLNQRIEVLRRHGLDPDAQHYDDAVTDALTNTREALMSADGDKLPIALMQAFALGEPAFHRAADTAFWVALADAFWLDAAALSRGIVWPKTEPDHRPRPETHLKSEHHTLADMAAEQRHRRAGFPVQVTGLDDD